MAETLGGTPAEGAAPGKRAKKGRVLAEVDFSSEIFTEFKDAGNAACDVFESAAGAHRKAMQDLYSDCEKKTGIPTAIVKLLFGEERREAKRDKKSRDKLEKSHVLGLEKVAEAFKSTPFGELAARILAGAQVSVQ